MRYLTLLLTALCLPLSGLQLEIRQFDTVANYAAADTLIVLDLDNTLLEPKQELGNDQWFNYRYASLKKQYNDAQRALQQTLLEWEGIRYLSDMQLVEPGIDRTIKQLQAEGYAVMGLTTQSHCMSRITLHQLQQLGIDLSVTAPMKESAAYINERPVVYEKGVLFTDATDKGTAMEQLLKLADHAPHRIVFVNDKADNLTPVARMCDEKGIKFIGLRYGYLDEKVKRFDHEVADFQLHQMGPIINDEDAKALASKGTSLKAA